MREAQDEPDCPCAGSTPSYNLCRKCPLANTCVVRVGEEAVKSTLPEPETPIYLFEHLY